MADFIGCFNFESNADVVEEVVSDVTEEDIISDDSDTDSLDDATIVEETMDN